MVCRINPIIELGLPQVEAQPAQIDRVGKYIEEYDIVFDGGDIRRAVHHDEFIVQLLLATHACIILCCCA